MRNPIWVPVLLLAALFALQSTASNGQEIGSATSVKPQAEGTHEGGTRTLSGGSSVHARELIHTGDAGVADLRFHDNSNLRTLDRLTASIWLDD
jgi:hypothetical protein